MTASLYVDISAYQPTVDWPVYAAWARSFDGVARVAIKASEGVGDVDQRYIAHRDGALAAGVEAIQYYHYARPDLGNFPVAEALAFHRALPATLRPTDSIMLDYEVDSSLASAAWAFQWLARMQFLREGQTPRIYASAGYIRDHLQSQALSAFPLVLADWQYSPAERPPAPAPWRSYEALQYSDRATIPGMPGPVDANVFLGAEGVPMLNVSALPDVFTQRADSTWQLLGTDIIIGHGMLAAYRSAGVAPYFGYDLFGRPRSNEQKILGATQPDATLQVYERVVLGYHADGAPRGAGDVAPMRIDESGPALSALLAIAQHTGDSK